MSRESPDQQARRAIERPRQEEDIRPRLRDANSLLGKVGLFSTRAEQAKRRRLTLALAATVLLAGTLGGGGWLWVKTDRDARQAQVTREVNDALNKATALLQSPRRRASLPASLRYFVFSGASATAWS